MITRPGARFHQILIVLTFTALAVVVCLAQPKLTLPQPGKPPTMILPPGPGMGPEGPTVTVTPGPEPWYTVFGTGEVIGYVEPCG